MTAKLIDGKVLAAKVREQLKQEIEARQTRGKRAPGLAVILVGEDPASIIYVRNKRQACQEIGIESFYHCLHASTSEEKLIDLIQELNQDPLVDGILLQLPLPSHIDTANVLEKISPSKDVDGFHPYNLGRLAQRRPLLRPCTPFGIIALLDSIGEIYKNRHAVIVGASNIVGRPMALEMLLAGSTITICHRLTQDLKLHVQTADILIVGVGIPNLIKGEWVKEGATVIDVGMNRLANDSLTGDVEFKAACEKAAWITPVPGGVGPMTVATLMKNTVYAQDLLDKIKK